MITLRRPAAAYRVYAEDEFFTEDEAAAEHAPVAEDECAAEDETGTEERPGVASVPLADDEFLDEHDLFQRAGLPGEHAMPASARRSVRLLTGAAVLATGSAIGAIVLANEPRTVVRTSAARTGPHSGARGRATSGSFVARELRRTAEGAPGHGARRGARKRPDGARGRGGARGRSPRTSAETGPFPERTRSFPAAPAPAAPAPAHESEPAYASASAPAYARPVVTREFGFER